MLKFSDIQLVVIVTDSGVHVEQITDEDEPTAVVEAYIEETVGKEYPLIEEWSAYQIAYSTYQKGWVGDAIEITK